MMYLITGLPGASKTLNTIKWLNENKDFQNRPFYYHNINELTFDWNLIDDPMEWNSLPDGSVIILDEAQEFFPARGNNRPVPEYIEPLAKHRHKGYDIIFITQHPNLLDVFVRRLIGDHTHYSRPFGAPMATRMHWPKVRDPDDYHAVKEAEKSGVRLDKKYFGTYKSAELHTHKLKIPKKLIIFFIIIAIASYFAVGFYNDRIIPSAKLDVPITNDSNDKPSFSNPLGRSSDTELTRAESLVPRLKGLPHTAPIYDHLTEPKVYPWPNCVATAKFTRCTCYTQQGSKMDIPFYRCKSIIENGLFDPALEPRKRSIAPQPTARVVSEARIAGGASF